MHSGSPRIDESEATEMYESGMLVKEVAEEFDVSFWTASRAINSERPWQDEEKMRELYQEKKLPAREVADELGCHRQTVNRWLHRHGIEVRSHVEEATRTKRKKPASHRITRDGYEVVEASVVGSSRQCRVHRLVAVAECGINEVAENVVHHRNGIPWDNRPENLEVMTPAEHATLHDPVNVRWGNSTPREAHNTSDNNE